MLQLPTSLSVDWGFIIPSGLWPVFCSVHLMCHKTAHYFKNTYLTLLRASLVSCTVQGLNECSFNTKQINKKRNIKHNAIPMLTFIVECMYILTTCFAFINYNLYSAFFSRKLQYYVDLYLFRNVLLYVLGICITAYLCIFQPPALQHRLQKHLLLNKISIYVQSLSKLMKSPFEFI